MKLYFPATAAIALFSVTALAATPNDASLLPGTTIPIVLTKKIDAAKTHPGDAITGKTTQAITLASGQKLPKGALLQGHVVEASQFQFDPAHYAVQHDAELSIQFDNITSSGYQVPLHVYVRAMADPVTVSEAHMPKASDMDPLGTTTQVGGDLVTLSQDEVLSAHGDIVGYKHDGGIYAHLIASRHDSFSCNGSSNEQAMGIFSASACGIYGFAQESLAANANSVVTLVSNHYTPRIYANTAMLLEEQPSAEATNEGLK